MTAAMISAVPTTDISPSAVHDSARGLQMRGRFQMFSYIRPEKRIPANIPCAKSANSSARF
jgi:hypothetical protein